MIGLLTMISVMGGVVDPSPESLCARIGEIRSIPMKGPGSDEVYRGLLELGEAAVPCLIEKIADTTAMPDPRMAPTYSGVVVGDTAFFILLRITGVKIEEMLPEEVRAKYKDQGVYAYFEYVSKAFHREELQRTLREWRAERQAEGAGQQHRRE